MAKVGRPSKQAEIDADELKELMKFCPTRKEASDWFDVSNSTLDRFIKTQFNMCFEELRDKSFVRTRISLKRAQWKKAIAGDNTMMIWLGKQHLGQSDKLETENTHAIDQNKSDSKIDELVAWVRNIKNVE